MNEVDFIVLGLAVFTFWRGWAKGLLRSLLGPVILAGCLGYAYVHYVRTRDILLSLGISILGPIVLNIVFWLLFAVFGKMRRREENEEGGFFEASGRMSGGVISMIWTVSIVMACLVFFMVIPVRMPGLEKARTLVSESGGILLVKAALGDRLQFLRKDVQPLDLKNNQVSAQRLQESFEYTALMEDDRVRDVFSDPETVKKIQDKDVAGLMKDPKIQALMQDPALVRKFFRFNQAMIRMSQDETERREHVDDLHKNYQRRYPLPQDSGR